jgi:hypothetical protein
MTAFLREIQAFNASDWIWTGLLLAEFFAGVAAVVFVVFKSLKRLKLYVGKDGIKINDSANSKLDHIIERLKKLERDVVALQIMNEHITPFRHPVPRPPVTSAATGPQKPGRLPDGVYRPRFSFMNRYAVSGVPLGRRWRELEFGRFFQDFE